jgi:lysophospholipase L1-like esterase
MKRSVYKMSENNKKWVTAWGNAISISERRPENYAKNLTLRYPIKMMISGEKIRINLDNFCGNESVNVSCVYIAESDGNDGINGSPVQITFGGSQSVTIPAGESIKSDEIDFHVNCGEYIAVSLYFEDFTEMRSGVIITGPLSKGYFAIGNQTTNKILDCNTSKKTDYFYFLSGIEVLADKNCRTVVCYGDSITAQAWPDFLMQRVLETKSGTTAVIRKAASGTRILRQYDNITYDSYGLKGSVRFEREVIVPGADTVIIQHGINDIIHPVGVETNRFRPWSDLPTSQQLIDGLRMYIDSAHKHGLKAYIGTLLPIEGWRTYADFREKLRCEVNEWIRCNNESDGLIDFDRALCNPDNPSAFADSFDSGDHLHPSIAAYKRMAETVPAEIL